MNRHVADVPTFEPPPYVQGMQRIDDYAEIEEVLRSPHFLQGSHQETKAFLGDSVLMLHGKDHFEKRRLFSHLISRGALDYYEKEALIPVIAQSMDELKAQRGPDGLVRADLIDLTRIMLHRITAVVTGVDGVDTREHTDRFRFFVVKLGEGLSAEWDNRNRDEVIATGLRHRADFIREFLSPSLERRRALVARHKAGEIARADLPTDLFTLLCLNWDPEWDADYVWREACLFLVAATQTTTHIFPHIAVHVPQWLETHPEDAAKLEDPAFLRLVANEALRLHQPAPTLLRIAEKDVTLSTGRNIARGEHIALFFVPANRDEKIFGDDANRFNPYRPASQSMRPWGLTFGSGVHLCIGRPLVTGAATSTGDGESQTEGTMVRMLRALYGAGMELDPEDPPQRVLHTHFDAYERLPIILRRL